MPTNSKIGDGDDAPHHHHYMPFNEHQDDDVTVHTSDSEPPSPAKKHPPPAPLGCFETENPTCLNCNTSHGSLLVCIEPSCPIAFHHKCLRCMATFDDFGNFYCPYCAYKRAISESFQTRKNAFLAKRLLSDFMDDNKMPSRHKRKADVTLSTHPENVDPSKNTSSTSGKETTGHINERLTTSFKNPSMKLASPIPTGARRKKLMWTSEEEDMLKEAVPKFSTTGNNIPWRKILDFGRHIFDGTRTPEDLKDKWKNNLAKKSSPVKKMSR